MAYVKNERVVCPICNQERWIDRSDFKNSKLKGICKKCQMTEWQKGKNNPSWKGGVRKDVHGYVHILMPKHPFANNVGYVRESRLMMEKKLGRYLFPKEVVHHLNGVKDDNSPENLTLFPNKGEHTSMHRKSTPRDWRGRFMRKVKVSTW